MSPYRESSPPPSTRHPVTVRACLYCGELLELATSKRCPAKHPPIVPFWRALLELVVG